MNLSCSTADNDKGKRGTDSEFSWFNPTPANQFVLTSQRDLKSVPWSLLHSLRSHPNFVGKVRRCVSSYLESS